MIFQEFVKSQPLLSIILFSLIITFVSTWAYKLLINQVKMKEIKERVKSLQEKMKAEKDQTKMMQIQKEMLQLSGEQMRLSMKPMLFTFLPFLLVFAFLRNVYNGTGDIISWGINLPLVGTGAGWLLSYIILSLIFSIILRKIMNVQ
jgi:uncharacterized membrane protein (DUF106 family)